MDTHPSYLLLLVVIFLFVGRYAPQYFQKGLKNIPGPFWARISTLYRVSIVYKGKAVENYRSLHEKYGPVVRTGPYHVSISDPEVLSLVYSRASNYRKATFYSVSVPRYKGELLDNMFTAVDPALHNQLRAPTVQVFSMTNLRNYERAVDESTEIFMRMLSEVDGTSVDCTEWFQWYAFDTIASITYQRRLGFLENKADVLGMIEGQKFTAGYLAIIGQIPWLHWYLLGSLRFMAFYLTLFPNAPNPLGKLYSNIEREVRRCDEEEKHPDRKDFLSQLRAKDDPNRENFDRDIMNHLSNNILAGSETTAISIRAILYYLVKTPSAYRTVVEEILEADRKGGLSQLVTYDETQKLPYLQAVIKEALRLHAPTCFPLERVVPAEGLEISGHFIPANTIVGTTAPLMNMNKEVFGSDVDSFRPERWLAKDAELIKLMNRTFLTFGHGARSCIGKNIALLEITKLVPQILRHYDVAWASSKESWHLYSYWFCKQDGLVLKFTSRAP